MTTLGSEEKGDAINQFFNHCDASERHAVIEQINEILDSTDDTEEMINMLAFTQMPEPKQVPDNHKIKILSLIHI
jgi:hypothetical protein